MNGKVRKTAFHFDPVRVEYNGSSAFLSVLPLMIGIYTGKYMQMRKNQFNFSLQPYWTRHGVSGS